MVLISPCCHSRWTSHFSAKLPRYTPAYFLRMKPNLSLSQRQVHLDFHTSPHITDVGTEFDARTFAQMFKNAHVDSVTIFAKCHHGQCYYPTKTGTIHPALRGRDLLGEQIEALHREGIRCPVYTTIAWEEDAAKNHPEWRQITREGLFAEQSPSPALPSSYPGKWKCLNFLHPDYQDYIEAHVREIYDRYDVDGMFFDILFFAPETCWSEASLKFREKLSLTGHDLATSNRFNGFAQKAFATKFSKIIRGISPASTIFYNAPNDSNLDPIASPRARSPYMTHFEVESLPGGQWGYHHFPRVARALPHQPKPWLGMTGRFQRSWGDFGGIKPQAALEYECFRSQALGGGNSTGDQLPPRGKLDCSAYKLIGAVYKQLKQAEAFYAGSKSFAKIGVICASTPGTDGARSEEGAIQMAEESHYDFVMCDAFDGLSSFDLLILPDTTFITQKLRSKLAAFYRKGGKLVLSYHSGFDAEGNWALDFLPLTFHGQTSRYPTYWRAEHDFDPALSESDRVFYEPGMNASGGKGTRTLIKRVLPYFNRSDLKFCSHFQAPPIAATDKFDAVIAGDRFVYFADPLFREYRKTGNTTPRDVWKRVMKALSSPASCCEGLPSTVTVYPRRRGTTLLLTLLHYIPVRKALEIDIIEERHSFAGEFLKLSRDVGELHDFETKKPLRKLMDGKFELPPKKGRLLLESPNFFKTL